MGASGLSENQTKQKYSQSLFVEYMFANFPTHWNLFVAPKSIPTAVLRWSLADTHRTGKGKFPDAHVPSWGRTRQCSFSVSFFQLSRCKHCPLCSLFSVTSHIFVGDFAVYNGPRYSAEVLSSVPEQEGDDVPYERTCVLNTLRSAWVRPPLAVRATLVDQHAIF